MVVNRFSPIVRWMQDNGRRWHGPLTEEQTAIEAFAKTQGGCYNVGPNGKPIGFFMWRASVPPVADQG